MPKKRGSDYKTKRRNLWKPKSAKRNADGKIIVNNIYIGAGNAQRWFILKKKLNYTSDKDFVSYLLDLAEQQAGSNGCAEGIQLDNQDKDDVVESEHREYEETNDSRSSEFYDTSWKPSNVDEPLRRSTRKQSSSHHTHVRRSSRNNRTHSKKKHQHAEEEEASSYAGGEGDDRCNEDGPPMLTAESPLPPTPQTYCEMPNLQIDEPVSNVSPPPPPRLPQFPVDSSQQPVVLLGERVKLKRRGKRKWAEEVPSTKQKHAKRRRKDADFLPPKGSKAHDIRRAPRNGIPAGQSENSGEEGVEPGSQDSSSRTVVVAPPPPPTVQRVAIKIKLCGDCSTRHLQDACPLLRPPLAISDAPARPPDSEHTSDTPDIEPSLAVASLPQGFQLQEIDPAHGLSVVACCSLPRFTQLGPLVGQPVKEMDIPDDFNMRDIWDLSSGTERVYLSTEDADSSNWLRFMRPAPTRLQRNVAPVVRNGQLWFHTLTDILPGEELLYWGDHAHWGGKRAEKMNCGGCNLRFSHPLYYRMHCAVFHDPNFSLTIRKYHCKVCGATMLGKEHIMRHASEQHAGRGAYRCQFCSKFFLRLNYLEMHRTYGCAANPGRTRPLCDFCGRKFCQPQKLKVHIKRMHSDMASVLREFQCKSCLKLLGSRAALQRHAKEVHHKEAVGSVGCSRCGKTFQNKSNLKIHMLTHSGVKPFKCHETSCNAAFTTKQCLQFHYKKVHSYSEASMPVIERSVEYTFAAYSGGATNNRQQVVASDDDQSDDSLLSQDSNVDNKHDDVDSTNQSSKATPPTSGRQSPVAFSSYLKKRPTPPTSDDQASMSYSSHNDKQATPSLADEQTPTSNASPIQEQLTPTPTVNDDLEQQVTSRHSPAVYDSRCGSPGLHARLENTESCNMNFNSNSKDSDSAVEPKHSVDDELPSSSLCPTIERYTCNYDDKEVQRASSPTVHDGYPAVYQGSNSPTLQGYQTGYKSPLMQEGYSSPPLEEGYGGGFKSSQDGYPAGYGKVVVSKGSKKWLGEGTSGPLSPMCSSEIAYDFQDDKMSIQEESDGGSSKRKLRGKLSTASLLVEAALVAAERDILSDTPGLTGPSMRGDDLDTMYSLHRRSPPPVKPRHFLLCKTSMQPDSQSFVHQDDDDDNAQPASEPRQHFLHEDDNAHHFLRDEEAAQRHFLRDADNTPQHDGSYGLHYQEEVLSPEAPGRARIEYVNQRLSSPPESPVRGYELQPLSSDDEDISVAENLTLVKNKNLYELTPERGESRFELVSDVQGLDMSRSNYQSAYHSHRWSGVYGSGDQQTVDLSVSGPAYPEVLRVVGRVSHPLPYPPFPLPSPPYPPGPPYHPYQHYY